MKNFEKIRQFRKQKELTCAEFATKLGIAETTLRSLENGTRPITAERAIQIEEITECGLTRYDLRSDLFGAAPEKVAA